MRSGRTTLSKFLIDQLHGQTDQGQLAGLLVDIAAAIKAIAAATAKGALEGGHGYAGGDNVHGERQMQLDLLADTLMIEHCEWGGLVAGMASEEHAQPIGIPPDVQRGPYLLVFDPLDGSSNVAMNVAVGTIFSVLRHPHADAPTPADFLQPGAQQVAAGYAIYGPATMLVLTVGKGTHGFTLDREVGNFVLTHPDIRIPEDSSEFAINTSNERFWEPPVQRYVAECKAGASGIRGRDFNMRWIASMVADIHRVLMRGGVFMYPRDYKDPGKPGRLRLMYEASPIALVVEQAGGAATTGRQRLLDVRPESLHQRVPVILGSRHEVERIARYHAEYDNGTDKPYFSPLFRDRSLYRAQA
ncbi:class 1 fructose-bisphosphatase [Fontimonas sp. SYSU GA230001]|uniref:class 1 fructose-bisphosphatase n=1 Tax=Fontimonas sp. SYSU GA230001 TaxID=3142450 RepID=UPI0032B3DF50